MTMNLVQTLPTWLAALAVWCAVGTAVAVQPPPAHPDSDGIEVLARGPVHEAFAGTVTFDPQPGIVVPKAPPAAIEELPPEMKPEGANVEWIPGYWAFDDENADFMWISGTWRNLPPGRQWISGYWGHTQQGAQWTSGYWAHTDMTEVEYLPEPPESVEQGPNVAAPSADHMWLPGHWVWQDNRYAWRPGFWTAVQPDWVWVPPHYQWAPRGYVHVDGYWDYPLDRRGVQFAPIALNQRLMAQPGFSFTPQMVIDAGVFANHLFLRPNYGHYYFGDYYDDQYTTAGFRSSNEFHTNQYGYDPIYVRQRWQNRQESDWENRVRANFQHHRDHVDARPPRTFTAQQELLQRGLSELDRGRGRVFMRTLEQYTQAEDSPVRFQRMNDEDRQRYSRTGQEVWKHRELRQKLEIPEVDPVSRPERELRPTRAQFPRSPLRARNFEQLRRDNQIRPEGIPPQIQELPNIDPGVVPQPRRPGGIGLPGIRGGNPTGLPKTGGS